MPARKLVPSLSDLAIKIDLRHESSPAPSDSSSSSSVIGKRKCTFQELPDVDRDKRRKLMNRVAAQQSRDRKRLHVEQLELELKKLKAENATLKIENENIQREKERLKMENEQIKNQTEEIKKEENVISEVDIPMTFESAALISGPLPQGQVTRMYLLQTFVLLLQFLQSKQEQTVPNSTTFLQSSKSFAKNWSTEELSQIRQLITRFVARIPKKEPPGYRTWNPFKNSFSCRQISLTPHS